MVPVNNLGSKNKNISFDLSPCLDVFFDNNNDLSTGENILEKNDINCKYYDEQSLLNSFSTRKLPLAISINIQRLSSKFDKLQELISTFESNKVYFDVLAIQETWDIKDLKSVYLQSYHNLVFKSRSLSSGGGIGFYINKNLKIKIVDEYSIFNERIFESVCVEVEFSKNKLTLLLLLHKNITS